MTDTLPTPPGLPTAQGGFDGPPVYQRKDGVVVIRASAMGAHCTRAMVGLMQGLEKMYPPDSMQARFDDGHLHEQSTLDKMAKQADVAIHRLTETVKYVVLPGKVEIHGHLDGVVSTLGQSAEMYFAPAEAKAFSDSMFKQYKAKGGPGELLGYGMQAAVYMLATKSDQILYGVKNKNSGDVDTRWIRADQVPSKAEVLKRAMAIYKAVTDPNADAYQMACDQSMFPCPVFYIHEQVEKVEVEDVVLKGLLVRYKTAQQDEVAAKKIKDEVGLEIADRLKVVGEESLAVLGWSVTAKVGQSTGYDWDTIEKLTGRKKDEFAVKKDNSKATVTVTEPKGWTPGQQELL